MINAKPRNAIEINQLASALHSAEAKGITVERLSGTGGTTLYPTKSYVQSDVWWYNPDWTKQVSVNDLCAALNNLI